MTGWHSYIQHPHYLPHPPFLLMDFAPAPTTSTFLCLQAWVQATLVLVGLYFVLEGVPHFIYHFTIALTFYAKVAVLSVVARFTNRTFVVCRPGQPPCFIAHPHSQDVKTFALMAQDKVHILSRVHIQTCIFPRICYWWAPETARLPHRASPRSRHRSHRTQLLCHPDWRTQTNSWWRQRYYRTICWRCDSMSHDFVLWDIIILFDISMILEGHMTCLHKHQISLFGYSLLLCHHLFFAHHVTSGHVTFPTLSLLYMPAGVGFCSLSFSPISCR